MKCIESMACEQSELTPTNFFFSEIQKCTIFNHVYLQQFYEQLGHCQVMNAQHFQRVCCFEIILLLTNYFFLKIIF